MATRILLLKSTYSLNTDLTQFTWGLEFSPSNTCQTNTHYCYSLPIVSLCSSQHGVKQIKYCFTARVDCEAALRSDGRLCLQSYYKYHVYELYQEKYNMSKLQNESYHNCNTYKNRSIKHVHVYGYYILESLVYNPLITPDISYLIILFTKFAK